MQGPNVVYTGKMRGWIQQRKNYLMRLSYKISHSMCGSHSMEVVKRGTRWRVDNGERILIWEDKWLPTPTTFKVVSPPKSFDDYPRVSALIDKETKRWKGEVVRSLFLPFEARTILNIPLCHSLPED